MSTPVLAHAVPGPVAITVVAVGGLVAAYVAGAAGRRPSTARRWRSAAFGLGVAALLVALASPLESAVEVRFSAHMGQHLLLTAVAGPALALAAVPRTVGLALHGRSRAALRRSGAGVAWRRLVKRGVGAWVPLAAGAHLVALAAWHLPVLHDLAVRDGAAHVLEHATLLGTAVALWAAVVAAHHAAPGMAFAALFATSMASGVLGALITFAPSPLYESYVSGGAGMTAVADQQLAGLLMWVPGGLVYLAGASTLLAVTLRSSARRRRRLDAAARQELLLEVTAG